MCTGGCGSRSRRWRGLSGQWQYIGVFPETVMMPNDPKRAVAEPSSTTGAEPRNGAPLQSTGDDLFRRLVESVHDYAIFAMTPGGVIISWNAGAERIKGYAASEIVGKHFSIFYTPEALAADGPADALRRALAAGHFEDEGWRVRKDGTRFWANAVITPMRGADGGLLGYSKVTRDLTERREHESRLGESERSLRLLVEGVQDYAIFMLDPAGIISSWNLGAERIKGYTAREAIGRHFSMFYPREDVERGWPQEELKRAREMGRFEDEGWRVCKDGSRIWANVIITAIRDEDGQLRGFSKVTRDLSERRRHQEQLEEREQNLRLLVDGVKDHAMFLLDAAGVIRTWNSGAERVLGFAADEILGREVALLYTDEDRNAGRARAEIASARTAGYLQLEGWRRKSDGASFWAEVATTVLREPTGAVRGFVQIIRDLSERRRVEELESEGRRMSEFIAMLSHELRNPLAPIRNAVAILKKLGGTAQSEWCVELIGRQTKHMARLVDDLLDVSRITTGKIRLDRMPLDFNALVRMAIDSVGAIVQGYGHTLEAQLPEDPVHILGDSTRLSQVLVNLLTNAAKYTPDRGRIRVCVERDGPVVRLEVSDNGIGMNEALLQRVFDPFVQGSRGLGRSEGGLGIGLTLVKTIVEIHGGTVTAASAGLGHGTNMTVTLPMIGIEEPATQTKLQGMRKPPASVLVVDDNRDAAESLAALLQFAGHDVQTATGGAEALEFAAAHSPSVVLLDLGMPEMDGYEVARQLKKLPGMRNARLIAVTGYSQESHRRATAEAGFELHMTKPVDADELVRIIG